MNFFNALIHNTVFMSAVTGWFAAQVIKTVIYTCITKSFDPERLVGSGGMPSSHSATVCALATAAGMQYGGSSFEFAIAAIVAIIVMYDARGVRRETGLQAQVINEMMEFWKKMGQPISYEEKLKEFVGHTPLQVFVGALLGIRGGMAVIPEDWRAYIGDGIKSICLTNGHGAFPADNFRVCRKAHLRYNVFSRKNLPS